MTKIKTFLWFQGDGEAAARFYTSVFKKSKLGKISYYGDHFPGMAGKVMTVEFQLMGMDFVALNGDSDFKYTPAVSFMVPCKTQKEVDYYWKKLSSGGGKEIQCGWLTDKFGVTWQVVPEVLFKMTTSKNKEKANRVMQVMCKMVKLNIAALQKAFDGK